MNQFKGLRGILQGVITRIMYGCTYQKQLFLSLLCCFLLSPCLHANTFQPVSFLLSASLNIAPLTDVSNGDINPEDSSQSSIKVDGRSRIFRWKYSGPPYELREPNQWNFLTQLQHDLIVQVKAPFAYAIAHPVKFGVGASVLSTLIFTDHETLDWIAPRIQFNNRRLSHVARQISKYGTASYLMPVIAGLGAYGWLGNSPRETETFRMVSEAVITSCLWTELLKYGTGRERPYQSSSENGSWKGPIGVLDPDSASSEYMSFPSGHSSAIWSIATILAHQYPDNRIVPILSYTTASIVAYSRAVVEKHYLSDIVVGSALGYFCARQVLRDYGITGKDRTNRIAITHLGMNVLPDNYELRIHFRFAW